MSTSSQRHDDINIDAKAFANDPTAYFDYSFTRMHSLSREDMEALQLAALQYRFDSLYKSVPMVKKMADKQGLRGISRLEDVVPMLFEHTMYKSYPPSLLDNNRFDQLTKWFDKLTAYDLSSLNTSSCQGVDDWVDLLDKETPLQIMHSSGTSGVMSFLPVSKEEYSLYCKHLAICFSQKFGDPAPPRENPIPKMHIVVPSYRYGASAFARAVSGFAEYYTDSEDEVHTLYPGKFSSDALYLTAKIQAAKLKGNLDSLKINPTLLARKKEFEEHQVNANSDMQAFLEHIARDLKGQRVFLNSVWTTLYDFAKKGLEKGLENVFSPDSVIAYTGGAKGMTIPEDFEESLCRFTGVDTLKRGYGMGEVGAAHMMCAYDRYHQAPHAIVFVLDPDTSEMLPRKGVVTGRAAFYDLIANSHWGGFISGDEVTVHWDGDCPCGAETPYFEEGITRYSEKRGGDDKINCTATPEAHREAMAFLTSL